MNAALARILCSPAGHADTGSHKCLEVEFMEDADRKPKRRRSRQKELDVLSDMSGRPQATDVLGSYTGTPSDGGQPVQDADDL